MEIKINDVVSQLMLFCDDCLNTTTNRDAVLDAFKSLCEVNSIDEFVKAVGTFADDTDVIDRLHYRDPKRQMTVEDCSAKIKGDLFEILTYIYFNHFAGDDGVFGIKFAPYDQKGWDFEANNIAGNRCFIQSKFISRGTFDGDLTTFYGEGAWSEGIANTGDGSVSGILFTSAERVSHKINQYAYDHDSFKIIDREVIRTRDFPGFWKTVNEVFRDQLFVACDFNKEL